MRRWIPILLLAAACSADEGGDTDFWWADSTGFEYDPCYDSPLVGSWAEPSAPNISAVIFETSCSFTEVSGQMCTGGAEFEYVTAMTGTVTIRVAGSQCASCDYTVNANRDQLTLDCGIGGIGTTFVETINSTQ